MSSTSISEPPGFSELSKSEQVDYLMFLWDQITESSGELPVPESHLQLAESRLNNYREDPTGAHSSFDVLDRLAKTKGEVISNREQTHRRFRHRGGLRVV